MIKKQTNQNKWINTLVKSAFQKFVFIVPMCFSFLASSVKSYIHKQFTFWDTVFYSLFIILQFYWVNYSFIHIVALLHKCIFVVIFLLLLFHLLLQWFSAIKLIFENAAKILCRKIKVIHWCYINEEFAVSIAKRGGKHFLKHVCCIAYSIYNIRYGVITITYETSHLTEW